MAQIIDLDVVLAPPVRVKLNGTEYKLPADIPLPLYLAVKERERTAGEDDDVVETLHQQVLELFQVHQPELQTIPCGMVQLFQIIPLVYGGEDENPTARRTSTPSRRGSARRSNSAAPRKRRASAS